MQRFNNFTKKSGKVASAILSAAMVTSMLAGTNVVYAATEATETTTTDVKGLASAEDKAVAAKTELEKAYKDIPVTTKTSVTSGSAVFADFKDPADKVKENKDYDVKDVQVTRYKVTNQPTTTKAGEAELTFVVTPTSAGAITDTVKYDLPSGKDRASTVKTALQKYIDKDMSTTVTNGTGDQIYKNVLNEVDKFFEKTTKDNGILLYDDIVYGGDNLVVNAASGSERGTVEGTISYVVINSIGGVIGGFDVTVNKEVLTDQETVDAAQTDLDKFIGEVKYFNSTNVADYEDVFDAFEKDNVTYISKEAKLTKSAGKTITGEATFNAELVSTKDSNAKAKVENKKVTIPSDNAKVESVLADFVEYAKSASVEEKTTETDFVKAVVGNFKDDNKDINVGKVSLDGDTLDADKVESVYGDGVTVSVTFTEAKDAKDDKPVAEITVTVNETTKKAIVDTFGVKAEESKGSFEEKDGKKYYYDANGNTLQNTYLQGTDSPDGYTYYIQADGSVMQDRLTYTPDGKYIIYFDEDGHEVFDAFVNVKKDMQGNDVDYIAYFDTFGHAYTNITTYGNGEGTYSKDSLFYINDYGVLQTNGWFKNAEGNIGYAAENGALTTSQWGVDQFGRKVYFQANGFLAKGLITDGVKYYQLDENDGHLVGEF